jgi:hypothetical protein
LCNEEMGSRDEQCVIYIRKGLLGLQENPKRFASDGGHCK